MMSDVNREQNLRYILKNAGFEAKKESTEIFADGIRKSDYFEEAMRVYRSLGGRSTSLPAPGRRSAWDVCTGDTYIELDEEQHFNRYRFVTLQSSVYKEILSFPIETYKQFCTQYESDCLRKASRGIYWSSPSTVDQFGAGSSPGDLRGNGSPRWKQRAFYDYIKDLFSLISGQEVVRLSIWDMVMVNGKHVFVGELLSKKMLDGVDSILELIDKRKNIR